MIVKRFKQTQKFRINIGSTVSFYATAKQIRAGVGDFYTCNAATQKALEVLEVYRSGDGVEMCSTGLGGTWEGLQVQLNMV